MVGFWSSVGQTMAQWGQNRSVHLWSVVGQAFAKSLSTQDHSEECDTDVGQVLVKFWSGFGQVLVKPWHHGGNTESCIWVTPKKDYEIQHRLMHSITCNLKRIGRQKSRNKHWRPCTKGSIPERTCRHVPEAVFMNHELNRKSSFLTKPP